MARKEFAESHNQTDVRYIRRHPKHDRFPVRRLGFACAYSEGSRAADQGGKLSVGLLLQFKAYYP